MIEGILGGAIVAGVILVAFRKWMETSVVKSVEHRFDKEMEKFKKQMRESERINQEKWEIKREACLDALKIVDADWSHRDWSNSAIQARPQDPPSIDEVRACHSRLALSCESERVTELYLKCLGVGGMYPADTITHLRNEIRKELNLGSPLNREGSDWIPELHSLMLFEERREA